ncbi:hypothetical protein STAS_26151 [Striga asiatica]|uniref:KIB1-4 beta-propeller domain-containing protein n=1 Tax=Striga asiatica TaxID=4170 RepID=A0A5A7QUM8_STRAF|nr:hypothetical protein STAS_26151 [Striga asiatica]
MESWDLKDPGSPASNRIADDMDLHLSSEWAHEPATRMAVAGQDILFVTPHTTDLLDSEGLCGIDYRGSGLLASVTIDFDVNRYEAEGGDLVRCSSLGNWAVFVGNCSHAVALPAAQLPGLRPNSIYFTDLEDTEVFENDELMNGHDIGIFDCEKKTVLPYGGYHVLDESTHYIIDLRPTAQQLWKPPISVSGQNDKGGEGISARRHNSYGSRGSVFRDKTTKEARAPPPDGTTVMEAADQCFGTKQQRRRGQGSKVK